MVELGSGSGCGHACVVVIIGLKRGGKKRGKVRQGARSVHLKTLSLCIYYCR